MPPAIDLALQHSPPRCSAAVSARHASLHVLACAGGPPRAPCPRPGHWRRALAFSRAQTEAPACASPLLPRVPLRDPPGHGGARRLRQPGRGLQPGRRAPHLRLLRRPLRAPRLLRAGQAWRRERARLEVRGRLPGHAQPALPAIDAASVASLSAPSSSSHIHLLCRPDQLRRRQQRPSDVRRIGRLLLLHKRVGMGEQRQLWMELCCCGDADGLHLLRWTSVQSDGRFDIAVRARLVAPPSLRAEPPHLSSEDSRATCSAAPSRPAWAA